MSNERVGTTEELSQIKTKIAKLKRSGVVVPSALIERGVSRLAQHIDELYKEEKKPLPIFGFLSRGGLHLRPRIAHQLDISDPEIIPMELERLGVEGDKDPQFKEHLIPTQEQVEGREVLLVDVACRSGSKLSHAHNIVEGLGASSVNSAVLFDTSFSKLDNYHPAIADTRDVTGTYYILPWEYEALMNLSERQRALEKQLLVA